MLQTPLMVLQQSTVGGTHGLLGVQVEPTPAHVPPAAVHAAAFATIEQTLEPAAFTVQQAPWVPGGQGFGVQLVALTEKKPVGQTFVPATIWQTPVTTLQHSTLGGTHGFEGVQVVPTPAQMPVQAVGPATIVHTLAPAAFTVQHAPFTGGGHGLVGRQVCPVDRVVPGQGVPKGTIVQLPAASQHAYRFAADGQGLGTQAVIVVLIAPEQLAGVYTIRQLLLMSQQNSGGHELGVQAEKLPNHPDGQPRPGKFEHAPVLALQQLVEGGGHGLGVHVVLLVSTVPAHGVLGVMSVQLPALSQQTTTGQMLGVQTVPTIVDPARAQNRGLVIRQTFPQQHATVGPTHGALTQLSWPGWNTVPPLAVHWLAVVTMHPAGLQHTPNTVALHSPGVHTLPVPCHAPPCMSHSHWLTCTHVPPA
jgi:hypothetical protein